MSAKSVYVTGDLVWDTHIARLPRSRQGYHEPHGQTQLANRHGGAWYLQEVIKAALTGRPLADAVSVTVPRRAGHEEIEEGTGPLGIAKSFTVWEWFPEPKKSGAWRLREFLGCQSAVWKSPEAEKPARPFAQTLELPSSTPDVLVIDDLGLGFAENQDAWPAFLQDGARLPATIIAKTTPSFGRPLWLKLLAPECAGRLSLVLGAAALRDAGARLGPGLSWDRTLKEVKALFEPGGVCRPLRHCGQVVVTFGRCGAAVFSRQPQAPGHEPRELEFERLVYDPQHLDGTWACELKGEVLGSASFMTAALVERELTAVPARSGSAVLKGSSHLAVSRALEAARQLYLMGAGGSDTRFMQGSGESQPVVEASVWEKVWKGAPEKTFFSAYNRSLLDAPLLPDTLADEGSQSLLTDVVGASPPFLTVTARQIVMSGAAGALRGVPCLKLGAYLTADSEEIERLNILRHLIEDYCGKDSDERPLSIAVFGQPGSGKSFAIKQLADQLFGRSKAVHTFNLSQMESLEDLHEAFHQVRDASVKGRIPLVFWDEFDAARGDTPLGWLKEFLAPMQDAEFLSRGHVHPLGKCIFVFAGGTSSTFAGFSAAAGDDASSFEKTVKKPDFISRLRGHVDIKGPNPADERDHAHIIRRAILLRALIERHHPQFVSAAGAVLRLHDGVLDAFLGCKEYLHGARSMEAVVSLSHLAGRRHFGPSELPPQEIIRLHASEDFQTLAGSPVRRGLSLDEIDELAARMHEDWRQAKKGMGYIWGPVRDDKAVPPAHPLWRPYAELDETDKARNRLPAQLLVMRLAALGCDIVPEAESAATGVRVRNEDILDKLSRSEHRRWMREQLAAGRSWAPDSHDALLLHRDICRYDSLPDGEPGLDSAIILSTLRFLKESGWAVVRRSTP